MVKSRVDYIRTVWVPVLHGCECEEALSAACRLTADVVLVGMVYVPPGQPLSAGAYEARQVRRRLRALSGGPQVRYKAQVLVSHHSWTDLITAIAADEPDLLLLEWPCQIEALHVTAAEVLTRPPCDIALVRGPVPDQIRHVLVPVRGGPHAELALRVGLSANPIDITALHLTPKQKGESDAPFRGLEQIFKSLPEIKT
jgi:glucosyl-3-phosphoglycerate synthase